MRKQCSSADRRHPLYDFISKAGEPTDHATAALIVLFSDRLDRGMKRFLAISRSPDWIHVFPQLPFVPRPSNPR